jgi:hypothetical protein
MGGTFTPETVRHESRRPKITQSRLAPEKRHDDRSRASRRCCHDPLVSLRDSLCATRVSPRGKSVRPQRMDRSATRRTSRLKCLKEPLARLANRQDETRGAFFEGRFKSVAILDEEALLATCAYIDLNPVAAGIVDVPEASPHTSITERVEHVKAQGRTGDLEAAGKGSVAGSNAAKGLEESHWLCPIEDRRRLDSSREGMIEGLSVGSYLLLIDFTGRLFRDGKAVISAEVAGILERLGSNAESWCSDLGAPSRKEGVPKFSTMPTYTYDRFVAFSGGIQGRHIYAESSAGIQGLESSGSLLFIDYFPKLLPST